MLPAMTLSEYLALERGRAVRLAQTIGVHPVVISQWSTGVRQVPAERCPDVERATEGAVRCETLRPDVHWDVLREQAGGSGRRGNRSAPAERV
jgi:DNA-binding transcriptional regulator YdaS (Cro superfamily)